MHQNATQKRADATAMPQSLYDFSSTQAVAAHLISRGWSMNQQTKYYQVFRYEELDTKVELTPDAMAVYHRKDDGFFPEWRLVMECKVKFKLTPKMAADILAIVLPSDEEMKILSEGWESDLRHSLYAITGNGLMAASVRDKALQNEFPLQKLVREISEMARDNYPMATEQIGEPLLKRCLSWNCYFSSSQPA